MVNPTADRQNKWGQVCPVWCRAILVSAAAWVVVFCAIPPAQQNFPFDDDWAFAHGAIWFAEGSGIHYSNWASMPELGQWVWAAPFLWLIHLPHVALRISVIVLSWLGVMAFQDILRGEKVAEGRAAFGACVFALNPLVFILTGTFMTDVPALAFGLVALAAYARALHSGKQGWLWPATVFGLLAVTTRQTMLSVPLAAGVMWWLKREDRKKPGWWISLSLVAGVCLYVAHWFSQRTDIIPMHASFDKRSWPPRLLFTLHFCGLAVLPLCWRQMLSRWKILSGALLAVLALWGFVDHFMGEYFPYGRMFPYCQGVLVRCVTYWENLVPGQHDLILNPPLRMALGVLGVWGAVEILAAAVVFFRAPSRINAMLLFTLMQLAIILILPYFADRYLIVLLPGAIGLMMMGTPSVSGVRWPGMVVLGVYGLLGLALVHDCFVWNTARWELGREALASKVIQPADIEGGFEWDGWYASTDPARPQVASFPLPPMARENRLTLPLTRSCFPRVTGTFALAFSCPTGSVTVAKLPYSLWLPPQQKDFYLWSFWRQMRHRPWAGNLRQLPFLSGEEFSAQNPTSFSHGLRNGMPVFWAQILSAIYIYKVNSVMLGLAKKPAAREAMVL